MKLSNINNINYIWQSINKQDNQDITLYIVNTHGNESMIDNILDCISTSFDYKLNNELIKKCIMRKFNVDVNLPCHKSLIILICLYHILKIDFIILCHDGRSYNISETIKNKLNKMDVNTSHKCNRKYVILLYEHNDIYRLIVIQNNSRIYKHIQRNSHNYEYIKSNIGNTGMK